MKTNLSAHKLHPPTSNTAAAQYRPNPLGLALRSLAHRLICTLTCGHEPIISQQSEQDGQTTFNIYDPISQQKLRNMPEEQVRYWLDQHYNS